MDRLTKVNDHESLSNEPLFSKMISRLKQYEDADEQDIPVWAPAPVGTAVTRIDNDMHGEIVGYSVTKLGGRSILMYFPDKECPVIDEDGMEAVNPIYFKSHYEITA